ncbi:enzyme involved in deoxyribonucleotide synthesis [Bacillus phage vB_BceM-HSE3]|nr:enzyme involved in deoxyribonucleotide synthesis [Bacillus phage vB_BceM-HSE3]
MRKEDEMIIVAPRGELFNEKNYFNGISKDENIIKEIIGKLDRAKTVMRRGSDKETWMPASLNSELNFDYKQPIPYAVIRRGHEIFLYERLSGGGESRLHNKLSIGVGGHMNLTSFRFSDDLEVNIERELEEELIIDVELDPRCDQSEDNLKPEYKVIGLLNDDNNSVGQVHLGLFVIIDLHPNATVKVKEVEQLAGRFVSVSELAKPDIFDRLETWSQLAVDEIGVNWE